MYRGEINKYIKKCVKFVISKNVLSYLFWVISNDSISAALKLCLTSGLLTIIDQPLELGNIISFGDIIDLGTYVFSMKHCL
jgi:hypothetical protein